jgi:hypothetical protein
MDTRESGRKMVKTDIEGYEVEVVKRGRVEVVDLLVGTVRGLRGRRKLIGEALMSDPYTAIIDFQVKHAKDMDDLLDRFMRQLIRRGYRPRRWRARIGESLEDWNAVDEARYDFSELEVEHNVETQEV